MKAYIQISGSTGFSAWLYRKNGEWMLHTCGPFFDHLRGDGHPKTATPFRSMKALREGYLQARDSVRALGAVAGRSVVTFWECARPRGMKRLIVDRKTWSTPRAPVKKRK